MDIEQFQEKCKKGSCLRKTFISKNCKRESKQKQCYEKWIKLESKKLEKISNTINIGKDFISKCWNYHLGFYEGTSKYRDWKQYCMLWKILSVEERKYILTCSDLFLNENLDVAHIEGKGSNPDKKYDVSNTVIIGRLFHRMLDDYKDPVTRDSINEEERKIWFNKIKKGEIYVR